MSAKKKGVLSRLNAGAVALFACLFAVVAAVSCWWQLAHYEDNLLEVFAEQQDQYVQLAIDQIELFESQKEDDMVENVLQSIVGDDSQYWTFAKDNRLLFVKDASNSNRYRGLTQGSYFDSDSAQQFIQGLAGGRVSHAIIDVAGNQYIASGAAFEHDKKSYALCLLTGKHVVTDDNDYLAARVNLGVIIAVTLIVFILALVAMAVHNDRQRKRLREAEKTSEQLQLKIESLGKELLRLDGFQEASEQQRDESQSEAQMTTSTTTIRRIYKFKCYLNASHFVSFDGKQGDQHPHTWEFSLKILVHGSDLRPFDVYERAIKDVFEPYQNRNINDVPPFDLLVPTLETLVERFGKRLHEVVEGLGGQLLEISGSETPTRNYAVSYVSSAPSAPDGVVVPNVAGVAPTMRGE